MYKLLNDPLYIQVIDKSFNIKVKTGTHHWREYTCQQRNHWTYWESKTTICGGGVVKSPAVLDAMCRQRPRTDRKPTGNNLQQEAPETQREWTHIGMRAAELVNRIVYLLINVLTQTEIWSYLFFIQLRKPKINHSVFTATWLLLRINKSDVQLSQQKILHYSIGSWMYYSKVLCFIILKSTILFVTKNGGSLLEISVN